MGSNSAPTRPTRGNDDRQTQAIGDVIFFAGEHTHYQGRYQGIDGAYETGIRAAREVLESAIDISKASTSLYHSLGFLGIPLFAVDPSTNGLEYLIHQ